MKNNVFIILFSFCLYASAENNSAPKTPLDNAIFKGNKYLYSRLYKSDYNNFVLFAFLNNEYKLNNLIDTKKYTKKMSNDDYLQFYNLSGLVNDKKCISENCFDSTIIFLNLFQKSIYSHCPYFDYQKYIAAVDSLYNNYFLKKDFSYEMCGYLNITLLSLSHIKKKINQNEFPNDIDKKIAQLIADRIIFNDSIDLKAEYKVASIAIYLHAGFYSKKIDESVSKLIEIQNANGSWTSGESFYKEKTGLNELQLKSYYRSLDRNSINTLWSLLAYKKLKKIKK
jgi:hypothetical protein